MTKKHFEAIAAMLASYSHYDMSSIEFDMGHNHAHDAIANSMADYFETINPNFNREQFLTACGL